MSKTYYKNKIAVAVATASSLICGAACAADWQIEEVMVTAQKREQSVQDIPVSVSAFSGDMMKNAQFDNAKEIALLTPGVSGNSPDSYLDTINIRGISTNSFGLAAESAIGLYSDGVYIGRTGGAVTSFFDIDRVEVVKGPQGTLFGRNASAGAISIHTKKAVVGEFSGSLDVGVGSDGYQTYTGVLNTPLSENLASRLAIYHREVDGYIDNVWTGERIGDEKADAARLSFTHQTESTTSTLTMEYEDRLAPPAIDRADSNLYDDDEIASEQSKKVLKDDGEVWGVTLNIEHDISDTYSLTSITGYRGHNYFTAKIMKLHP